MLKEKEELGKAIHQAILANGFSLADAARKFDVKRPSVTGWIKTGRISKGKFQELKRWLSKTPESHWNDGDQSDKKIHSSSELDKQEKELIELYRQLKTKKLKLSLIGTAHDLLDLQTNEVNAASNGKDNPLPNKKAKTPKAA